VSDVLLRADCFRYESRLSTYLTLLEDSPPTTQLPALLVLLGLLHRKVRISGLDLAPCSNRQATESDGDTSACYKVSRSSAVSRAVAGSMGHRNGFGI
jgi:hypothetical protein